MNFDSRRNDYLADFVLIHELLVWVSKEQKIRDTHARTINAMFLRLCWFADGRTDIFRGYVYWRVNEIKWRWRLTAPNVA